jgi:hypothetical protein
MSRFERLPVDVSLLLDTSGSVAGIIDSLKSQIRAAAALLSSSDRLRLLVFAGDASQVFPMQSPGAELPLDEVKANGLGTSLYDSLAAALIRQRAPDRGELVVAFSDGIDTTSAMSVKKLEQVASRSEAVPSRVHRAIAGVGRRVSGHLALQGNPLALRPVRSQTCG